MKEKKLRLLPEKRIKAEGWLLALGAALMLILLETCARGSFASFAEWVRTAPFMAARGFVFLLGLVMMLSAVRSNRLRGVLLWILAALLTVIGFVNRYKLLYRFEPVLLSDLSLMGDALVTLKDLHFSFNWKEIMLAAAVLAALLTLILLFARGSRRIGLLVPAAGLALAALIPLTCTYDSASGGKQTNLAAQFRADGVICSVFEDENYRRQLRSSVPDEARALEAWRGITAEAPAETAEERPNIILILSESFCDEDWLGSYVPLNRRLMPFYSSLKESCRSGWIYVPKVGGGTSESEFEVLSGISSRYSFNPYSIGLPPVNSAAAVLGAKGYETSMIHLFRGVYYNRYRNLHMEGFRDLFTTDTEWGPYERGSAYVSDEEHFRRALDRIRETEGKDFVFVITMQNHGGYDYTDPDLQAGWELPFTRDYSDRTKLEAGNYCRLLEETDDALRELIAGAETLDEPVWIIFFGDHIPPFGTDVYEELGIPLAGNASHMTPYFIWTNTGNEPVRTDLYATELMPYTLAEAGLGDDPFFAFVNTLREEARGEEMTGEGRGSELYDLLCQDVLFGRQYGYRDAGLSPAAVDTRIGGKMELTGFSAREEDGRLWLRPSFASGRPLRYTLYVNGKEAKESAVPLNRKGQIKLSCRLLSEEGALLNESNALTYAGADELKASCGKLTAEEYPLAEDDYQLISRNLLGWDVYLTERSYDCAALPEMRIAGRICAGKPCFDKLGGAWEYAFREDGRIYLAVPASAAPGCSSEEVSAWMEKENGVLILSR